MATPVRDAIVAVWADGSLTPAQKLRRTWRLRSEACEARLRAVDKVLPLTWTAANGNLEITLHAISLVRPKAWWLPASADTAEGADIRCDVSAKWRGFDVPLGDGIFVWPNPPTEVPDPNGEIVREIYDRNGNLIGATRWREDPRAGLRQAIVDTVIDAVRDALGTRQ